MHARRGRCHATTPDGARGTRLRAVARPAERPDKTAHPSRQHVGQPSDASDAHDASVSSASSDLSATLLHPDRLLVVLPSMELVLASTAGRPEAPRPPQAMHSGLWRWLARPSSLSALPTEVLLQILGFLDVNDLLSASRTSHRLRGLCFAPILHLLRLRRTRAVLALFLASAARPSLADLMRRSIFLTHTTVVSRKLARSLISIRLAHRLAARPPARVLVERCVLPPECAPGIGHLAPALVARTRAIERQRLKDGLKHWIGAVWQREVGRRSERIRRREEAVGVGRVWRLRKFWERISRGGREG